MFPKSLLGQTTSRAISTARCRSSAIFWVSLISFEAVTLCLVSQRMFIGGAFSLIGDLKKLIWREKKAFVLSFGFKYGKMDGETWNAGNNFGDNAMRRKYTFGWFSLIRLWGNSNWTLWVFNSPLHMPVKIVPKHLLVKRWKIKYDWGILSPLKCRFTTDATNRRHLCERQARISAKGQHCSPLYWSLYCVQCFIPSPRNV